jgi:hypothetical protein
LYPKLLRQPEEAARSSGFYDGLVYSAFGGMWNNRPICWNKLVGSLENRAGF